MHEPTSYNESLEQLDNIFVQMQESEQALQVSDPFAPMQDVGIGDGNGITE